MKKCSDTCSPICDFCRHYNFNAGKTGGYTGHGYCRFHHTRISPEGWCKDFWCFLVRCVQDEPPNKHPQKACKACAVEVQMTPAMAIYSTGLVSTSVCVPKEATPEEIEAFVNTEMPTGISSKWKISKDTAFKNGQSMPCVCEKDLNKLHYLLNC